MDFSSFVPETTIYVNEFCGDSNIVRIGKIGDQYVASKLVHYEKMRLHEIDILKRLDHSNIIKYLGNNNLEIYMSGVRHGLTLDDYFTTNRLIKDAFEVKLCVNILHQIADGLNYLHNLKIVHHDIKPKNILFDKGLNKIYLCDFGLAEITNENNECKPENRNFGTWMAPEQNNEKYAITNKIDVYCYGTLCNLIMIKGRTVKEYSEIYHGIIAGVAYLCQNSDPNERPTMGQILIIFDKLLLLD